MSDSLRDQDMPGFWRAADAASLEGQARTLGLTRLRIGGLIVAAASGVILSLPDRPALAAIGVVIGFTMALVAEVVAWVLQPERDWYSGRALAESTKTLAWRFAVAGNPVPVDMEQREAERVLAERLDEVSREARDRVTVEPDGAVVTPTMRTLRDLTFEQRRAAYVVGRLDDQHAWYAAKARFNRNRATFWRAALITGEVLAVILAILQVFQPWPLSFAGIAATLIACASSWIAVKQHSMLASAYSVTATELALLRQRVAIADRSEWGQIVDDAEEAISREHTLWLASRTGKAPIR